MKLFKRKNQVRADNMWGIIEGNLFHALFQKEDITKEQALSIPSVSGCINFISCVISMLPIKLYKENNGTSEEIIGDRRIRLLNDDTLDTLDSVQFWQAMIEDYFIGTGGNAFINKQRNEFVSLHYVKEEQISITHNTDPIFKDYDIMIHGIPYKPYQFIRILRNSHDGMQGESIVDRNNLILRVAYYYEIYEEYLVKRGGNKKGFLKSDTLLTKEVIQLIRESWEEMYSNSQKNVVVLNKGMEFQEASNTSVEMQLNENKKANAEEICKLFFVPLSIIEGTGNQKEFDYACKYCIMPLLRVIECALNRSMLLESEKSTYYFAFDTKELLRGNIKERFEAYKIGIDSNFLQIDEVRYMEDLESLGLDWIKLGLDTVLYNPKTKEIYTPNTNQLNSMNQKKKEGALDENRASE